MITGSIIELYVGGTQIKPDSRVSSHLASDYGGEVAVYLLSLHSLQWYSARKNFVG